MSNEYFTHILKCFKVPHIEPGKKHYKVLCPVAAHGDTRPSLSITLAEDGRVLLHCMVGCETEDVLDAVKLVYRDLYPPRLWSKLRDFGYIGDDSIANRYIVQHKDKILYCEDLGSYLFYDGQRWNIKNGNAHAMQLAKETARGIMGEVHKGIGGYEEDSDVRKKICKFAARYSDSSRLQAIVFLAKTVPNIRISADRLDQNEHLLNCLNGTINLKTGILQPHNPNDHITKLAPVEYPFKVGQRPNLNIINNSLVVWFPCCNTWMDDEPTMVKYLQDGFGYCLTGHTMAKLFFLFVGKSNSGKSTCLDTVTALLGDYASIAPRTLFKSERWDPHPAELETIRGKRLVQIGEPEQRMVLKTSLVKALTGDRWVQSRGMRQNFSPIPIQAKFILVSNDEPQIKDRGDAIWNRLKKIIWPHVIPGEEQNPDMFVDLKDEWPYILAWMVQGSVRWYSRKQVVTPDIVVKATEQYRERQNPVKQFVEECIKGSPGNTVTNENMWEAYRYWVKENRDRAESVFSQQELTISLKALGYKQKLRRADGKVKRCWADIKI